MSRKPSRVEKMKDMLVELANRKIEEAIAGTSEEQVVTVNLMTSTLIEIDMLKVYLLRAHEGDLEHDTFKMLGRVWQISRNFHEGSLDYTLYVYSRPKKPRPKGTVVQKKSLAELKSWWSENNEHMGAPRQEVKSVLRQVVESGGTLQ